MATIDYTGTISAIKESTDVETLREALLYLVQYNQKIISENLTGFSYNNAFEEGRKNMAEFSQESISSFFL